MPTSYTLVEPTKAGKPQLPSSTQSKVLKYEDLNGSVDDAMEWLPKPDDERKKRCTFSSFYSNDI